MDNRNEGQQRLVLLPGVGATKAAVSEGVLPSDYTVYLSAYFNNRTAGESSGNYITGEPFTKKDTYWSADPVVYWPMGGYLDFLALAAEDYDISTKARWYEDNVSRSVEVDVTDGSCLDTEILYSKASSKNGSEGCVALNFSHSQSWLQFRLSAAEDGTTRIDSIAISKAYLGGTLRIDNGVYLDCSWDYHGHFRRDYTLPDTKGLVLNTGVKTVNLLLPEQDACDITVWYTQKNTADTWDNPTRQTSYTVKANSDPWHSGTKTVYSMTVLRQVSVKASVHDWEDDNRQITID